MDFQKKILLDQRQDIVDQLKTATEQWTDAKKKMSNNLILAKQASDEKRPVRLPKVNLPTELDLLLQQLNFQRAWIDCKLKNLEENESTLTDPRKDQLKVQQLALETEFLKDFPIMGKSIVRKLKKLLKQNKMTVQSDLGSKQEDGLPKPTFSKLKKSIRKGSPLTPTKTWTQNLAFLRTHPALDRLRNQHGDFDSPNFSKETVEELLGHKVSFMTLSKIQKGLQLDPKKIKKRKRKSIRREGEWYLF